jgi:hypothetical protein
VRARVRGGGAGVGGRGGYPLARLREEVAYLAYHLHWGLEELLGLEHAERRAWVAEVAALNRRANAEAERERG